MTGKRGRPPHPDILTAAEWKVAEQVRHGLTNRRIAERAGVSPDAVKFHVGNVLAKLGLSSRRELQLWEGVAAHTALGKGKTAMDDGSDGESYVMLGQIARTTRNIPLSKVQDVTVSASIPQRVLGFGDIIVDNASEIGGSTVLHNINKPRHYADLLLRELRRWH